MSILIPMGKRINIVLSEATLKTIDRMAPPGQRSRFIDRAVEHFVATQSQEALRARLEAAAVRDRDLDRQVAEEWSAVDQEQWQRLERSENRPPRRAGRSAARSTSPRSTRQ